MIDHNTQLNMVIGYPLKHSLSPLLHNTIYQLLNYNAVLLAQANRDLAGTIAALKTLSVGYVAVTMPFKEAVLPYLDSLSKEAEHLKAVNTIICKPGHKLMGFNTDVDGIAYALSGTPLANRNILLVGGGGAAHAAAYYLKENNGHLFYLNRSTARSETLLDLFSGTIVSDKQLHDLSIDIIINATPLGMSPLHNDSILKEYEFNKNQTVFDMVYNPMETELLKKAQSEGAKTISGLDMFLAQGLKQFALWTNESLDIKKMIALIKPKLEEAL